MFRIGGLDEYNGFIDFQLFDITGRLLMEKTHVSPLGYHVSPQLPSGMYITRVFFPTTPFKPIIDKSFLSTSIY